MYFVFFTEIKDRLSFIRQTTNCNVFWRFDNKIPQTWYALGYNLYICNAKPSHKM